MESIGGVDTIVVVSLTREIRLRELISEGPEQFAEMLRAALEEELKPILAIGWQKLNVKDTTPETPKK